MDVRNPERPRYIFNNYRLDPGHLTLVRGGEAVATTPRVFATLLYLVENAERTVSKDEMLRAIWPGRIADEANLSQAISAVRKLLAADGSDRLIITVPGRGYRFTAPVSVQDETASYVPPPPPAQAAETKRLWRPPPWVWAAGAAAVLASGVLALAVAGWMRPHLPPGRTGVVLADLQNLSGDPAFDHVVGRVLQVDLAQSPFLQVASDTKVAEILALMEQPKDATLSPPLARGVCARTNGGAVITPAIASLGAHYVVMLAASDCLNGRQLFEDKAEAQDKEGVAGAVDRLSARLRRQLGEAGSTVSRFDVTLAPERTSSFAALKAYSEGMWLDTHGKILDAIPLYRHAIDLDPGFTMAYVRLSQDYYNTRQPLEDAAVITKAYGMRTTVSEPNQLFIVNRYNMVVTHDLVAALQSLKVMVRLYPKDVVAWGNLSNLQNWLGDYAAAIESGRKALALDPHRPGPYSVLARALNPAGRPAAALPGDEQAVRAGVAGGDTRGQMIAEHFILGDLAGAERLITSATGTPLEREALLEGYDIALAQGRVRHGLDLLARAEALGRPDGLKVDYVDEAVGLASVGLTDLARTTLRRAEPDGSPGYHLYAQALLDDPAKVQADLSRELSLHPKDTLLTGQYAPEVRAVLLMRQGDPLAAVKAIEEVAPFMFRALDAPYLRATALLGARAAPEAATAFGVVLAHPGLSTDPQYALAHLGLARANRMRGDVSGARREYQSFLSAWREADPDLPPLTAAKRELGDLPAA